MYRKIAYRLKSSFCKLKDNRKLEAKKKLVYKLRYQNCETVYIGESGRRAMHKLKEHRLGVEKRGE